MKLQYPVLTEKAVGLIEKENKMVFAVNNEATRKEIKEEFEKLYAVKVEKINIVKTQKGVKRAYIKLKPEFRASDLAAKLKIM